MCQHIGIDLAGVQGAGEQDAGGATLRELMQVIRMPDTPGSNDLPIPCHLKDGL